MMNGGGSVSEHVRSTMLQDKVTHEPHARYTQQLHSLKLLRINLNRSTLNRDGNGQALLL